MRPVSRSSYPAALDRSTRESYLLVKLMLPALLEILLAYQQIERTGIEILIRQRDGQ